MTISAGVLAQLAAAAYRETAPQNRISPPSGWSQIAAYPDEAQTSGGALTGFSATAYRGPGGEVVIAYTGTKDWKDWPAGNLPAAAGFFSAQVVQAAQFYWSVLNLPDVGSANKARIVFTGHSLGGGLASLMATYFDLPATTFDSAPFESSASGSVINTYAATFLALGIVDPSWLQYVVAAQSSLTLPLTFAQREARVTHVYVTNEILAGLRAVVPNIAAASLERPLDSGTTMSNGSSAVQLHSMLLAWSMLSNSTFAEQIRRLPRLYGLMQDGALFERPAASRDNDLHALLMQREGQTGMLTRFSTDLARISAGFADKSPTISDALIAVAMAFYYARRTDVAGDSGEASAAVVGGLQLALDQLTQAQAGGGGYKAQAMLEDVIDLLTGGAGEHRAIAGKERLTISDGAALTYSDADGKHDVVIGLTNSDVIAAGAGWDTIVASGGADRLDGGAGDDILDGGADDDVLIGGTGHDRMQGGVGNDDYYFAPGDGDDLIVDADGLGRIMLGPVESAVQLTGGKKVPGVDSYWLGDEINGVRYGFTQSANGQGGSDLIITKGSSPDKITIRNWQPGQLGITLDGAAATLPPPASTLSGDFNKAVDAHDPTQYVFDAQGNYVADGAQPNAADLITGTASGELIQGLGGDDALLGRAGDDLVEGGLGNDVLMGGLGADRIIGGDGNDLIYGSSNGVLTYPSATNFIAPAQIDPILLGRGFNWVHDGDTPGVPGDNPRASYLSDTVDRDTQPDDQGNLIDGGAGLDKIVAGTGADLVHGGEDADELIGLDGGDVLFGDGGNDRVYGDGWPNVLTYTPPEREGNDVIDGGAGNDLLVGGGADDEVYGGIDADDLYGESGDVATTPATVHGRDYLDGGAGADKLIGGGRDDELFGGSEDDHLWGDASAVDATHPQFIDPSIHGNDYLDGEGGADTQLGVSPPDLIAPLLISRSAIAANDDSLLAIGAA